MGEAAQQKTLAHAKVFLRRYSSDYAQVGENIPANRFLPLL
jgi:hypothetical protein